MNRENQLALSGKAILLTRAEHQREPLYSLFRDQGANVLLQPTIEIREPASWKPVDSVLRRMEDFDWIVFASSNGVRFFLDRFLREKWKNEKKQEDGAKKEEIARLFRKTKVAAIGPGTAIVMKSYGKTADLVPREHTSEGIIKELGPESRSGKRILILRASRGREMMIEKLTEMNPRKNALQEIVAYRSIDITQPNPKIRERLQNGQIDWITCTSSAIAKSLIRMFGGLLNNARLVSISPITSRIIRKSGFPVSAESRRATMQGVFEAVLAATREK